MAISNARSSAYRAGGNWKSWGRVKSGQNYVTMDTPKPDHVIQQEQVKADSNDEYYLTKAAMRAKLEHDCEGVPVTVVKEGKRAPKKSDKGLTKKRKAAKVKPSGRPNRKQRRALAQKVEQERLDKRKQFS